MKRAVVISISNIASDARVNRQIRFLSRNFEVLAFGLADPMIKRVRFVEINVLERNIFNKITLGLLLLLRRYEKYYHRNFNIRRLTSELEHFNPDVILANDVDSLPLAFRASDKAKIILDAHEYSPREMEDNLKWRIFYQPLKDHLCRKYINKIDGMLTVCNSVAREYKKNYNRLPLVMINAPNYQIIEPYLNLSGRIKLVHHGGAIPSRKIELMIDMMNFLDDRFSLDLILMPVDQGYVRKLKKRINSDHRIRILNPLPMEDITSHINRFDIGVYILEPNSFNNCYALPNKFFDFIQARLAVAIGPSIEMKKIVKHYDCGLVAKDFKPESLAHELMQVTPEKIRHYKEKSHEAAKELCFEENTILLSKVVRSALGQDNVRN